jgi:hypothetical protein
MLKAHRVSWEMANGPIPDGLHVLHNCPGGDNPSCVNPAHLYLGDHATNMADAARKGQTPRGDRHGTRLHPERVCRGERAPWSRLTAKAVAEMRQRRRDGWTWAALAATYGVGVGTVRSACNGRSWKTVA